MNQKKIEIKACLLHTDINFRINVLSHTLEGPK